ncbi:hypothetical protein AA0119_g12898 [Alternaria tenuissima]|jgi:hypothetical protein|uniref:Uncharacterized protein n=1 Tax=Alternaria tenuissima TaxID=119927 RepID=A0A4Q4S810_9PLEO|nr:hypothetical protein AA0115_g12802 [Alternaria tenuissima]RYN86433.1 hypothetical protein AA0119_g12898 [Alternaria tenuissima]RYO03566.1 hypothetical protein AA0121_g13052 [Alternaria tenuissima]RYO66221.1 hypothetical protein AA0116_g2971 [Alternaria tenuissima]
MSVDRLDFCNLDITLTHQSASNAVTFEIQLPLEGWNGLFQGVVGEGRASGFHDTPGFGNAVKDG